MYFLIAFALLATAISEPVSNTFQPDVITVKPLETTDEVDWATLEAIEWCSICKEVATYAVDIVADQAAAALKTLIKTEICVKKAGALVEICDLAVDKVIDLGLDLVKQHVDSQKICEAVKLC